MSDKRIPFNKPSITSLEESYVLQALRSNAVSGDGSFTKKCHQWFEEKWNVRKALLTHSCTAALEMAAILLDLQPGDEVIMPSFTFVSTANAVVLRGAKPVFVEVRKDTLNIDENKIQEAITKKTKAIYVVHYAGVSCEMDKIMTIARDHNLKVVEDAAQCALSTYKGKTVGTIGHFGAISFHETKNITCGEGGALFINDDTYFHRAEIIREKGTNRSQFFRGQVDKYTWVDMGSSYLPSDINAAFLLAQLERAAEITQSRLNVWNKYYQGLKELEQAGKLQLPQIPKDCKHNAHIFYFLVKDLETRSNLLQHLKEQNIQSTFHYVPLHSATAGLKYGRKSGDLSFTENLSERLIRLPLWADLPNQDSIINCVRRFFS